MGTGNVDRKNQGGKGLKDHILIVDDEKEIAGILNDYLTHEGFTTSLLDRGDRVADFIRAENPAMVLLDVMLPRKDGLSVCREIRTFSDIPIIMITARSDEIDRILGLEMGADDYICKPFSPREVVARVRSILRRLTCRPAEQEISAGEIRLNRSRRTVTIRGKELNLTPSEFKIFSVLLSSPNQVFSRTQLVEKVQGYAYEGYDRTIDFHIKNLRKKISSCLPGEKIIHSIYGFGYKLSYQV